MKLSNKEFEIGDIIYFESSGEYYRIDSKYSELQHGFWCTHVEIDENGIIENELSSCWILAK